MKFRFPCPVLAIAVPLVALFSGLDLAQGAASPRVLTDVPFLAADRAEKLDLYLPAPPANGKRSPAMVWIHGGGWTGGEKAEARAKEICTTFVNAGYVAISINYQLGDRAWPQNLLDCKNAVRFLRAHAAEYHLDPDRIGVSGGSAGAHLALLVGFTPGVKDLEPGAPYPGVSSAVRSVIDMYGPTNFFTREETDDQGRMLGRRKPPAKVMMTFGTTDWDAEVFRVASPATYVSRHSPPVLIMHGVLDPEVDLGQSRTLAAALEAQGVAHELVVIEGAGHTFDFESWKKLPMARDLRPVALAFLAKHMPAQP
ncbi:MAG: alpha/beta hydrolase [Opitutus sp.]|nr:alpha/beta hydrolase [Opitutus sp.]